MSNEFKDNSGKDIRGIRIYNPRQDGFTFDLWQKAHESLREIKPRLEYFLMEGLFARVNEQAKSDGVDLDKCINDYFIAHPEVATIAFVDGKFHSQYNDGLAFDGQKFAQETGSIPIVYHRPIETGEIEVEQDYKIGPFKH